MFVDIDYNKFQNEMNESLRQIFTESYEYKPEVSAEKFAEEQKHKDELYNKIKRILDCPEMEKCHPYLYSLDRENVLEEDEQKILKLYDCGINRGLIHEDECEEDQVIDNGEEKCDDGSLCGGPEDSLTNQPLADVPAPAPVPLTTASTIYTVLYSAKKDGMSKMGPFYSHAATEQGASEECVKFLNDNGYTDVEVMAIDRNAVDTEDGVSQEFQDDKSFEMYEEDDSEEFEKQETGDTSTEDAEVEVKAEENPEKDVEDVADDVQKDEVEVKDDKVEDVDTETKDDEKKDEDKKDKEEEKTDDNKEDEKTEEVKDEDKEEEDKTEDKFEDEDKEEDEEKKEEKKLTADEKAVLKEEYTKIFKDVLGKTGLEKSIDDMTLEERTSFYEKLAEKWTKNDPSEFMSAKEQAELNKKVVKNK